MKVLSYVGEVFSSLFHRAQADADLDEEFFAHIQRHADDLERSGLSRPEAERQARIAFGSSAKAKENCREQRPAFWLETIWQDVTYGLRMLRKSPSFTGIAMLTLALGIGANTAIFSVVDTVLLRPLPYRNQSNLVWATERFPFIHGTSNVISPDFLGWKDHNQAFDDIGAFASSSGANLTLLGEPARVDITNVTTNFLAMLGVDPVLGRGFLPSEGREGNSQVAILSESLWRGRFGADPHVIGKTVLLDDNPFTIVGVISGTLRYPSGDILTPLALDTEVFSPQSPRWTALTVIARLKPGVSITQAQSDLQLVTLRMNSQYPPEASNFRANVRVEVIPLHSLLVQHVRSLLLILLTTVAFILLIACANVTNLMLSRSVSRGREMAVRAALGASRSRLIYQMLTEASLLAVAGGAAGVFVGLWATKVLQQLIPSDLPSEIHLDPRILAYCIVLTILVIFAFGFFPALIASRPCIQEALKAGGSHQGTSPATHRLRAFLSAGEIALSLILLVGAGLLARSFLRLTEVDLGFAPHGLLIATVERPITGDRHSSQYATFFQDTLQRMTALPGVDSAALTTHYPLCIPNGATSMVTVQGSQRIRIQSPISIASVSAGYFRTMNIRLLKGRIFRDGDTANTPAAVIMNHTLAHILFGTRDPVGQHISFGPPPESWQEIVGVVSDTIGSSLEQAPMPEIFMPYLQAPSSDMTFILRSQNPKSLASSVRAAVQSFDKNQPLSELSTMDDILSKSVASRRFRMRLLSLFAILALALATIGIYGVMSYNVEQRTHEIGVRTALGAARRDILRLIVAQGFKITLLGILAGVVAALALTRFMASLLYRVSATDPFTFILVPLLLATAALVACYIPAHSASGADPMIALRHE